MIASLYNRIVSRVLGKSGGTLDTDAVITWQNQIAEKIRMHSASGYGFAVNSFELTIFIPVNAEVKIRNTTWDGTVRGTVWHSGNDGAGSGLDADLLDGANADDSDAGSTIAKRTSGGNLECNTVIPSIANNSGSLAAGATMAFRVNATSNKHLRFATRADVIAWLQAGGMT